MLLPLGIKYGINWYLDKKLVAYQGHIDDVDLKIYRGAYQVEGIKIWKRTSNSATPFIEIRKVGISLAWRTLVNFKVLSDIEVDGLKVNLIDSDDKKKKQFGAEEAWRTVVDKTSPIKAESFVLRDGEIHFSKKDSKVPVEVVLDKINVQVTNIRNIRNKKELLPSKVLARARIQKNAPVTVNGRMNFVSRIPAFDVNMKLEKLDVTKLNSFFLAYGPFNFSSGTLSLYAEASTLKNRIKGYVKPFLEHVEVIAPKEKFSSAKRFFNEIGLAIGNFIFKNKETDAVATKLEFEGSVEEPDIEKWSAFWSALRNAFGEALNRSLENSISVKSVPAKK